MNRSVHQTFAGVAICMACLILGILIASNAPAAVAISQPPNYFVAATSDASNNQGPTHVMAEDFVLDYQQRITKVSLWGFYWPGNTSLDPDQFSVLIHQDAWGLPGAVLYSAYAITPAQKTKTGNTVSGSADEYKYTLILPNPPLLDAGIYWIEIYNDTTPIYDDFLWQSGTLDTTHGIANHAEAWEAPGVTWAIKSGADFAFEIISEGVTTICSDLGRFDSDLFAFEGLKGEHVTVELIKNPAVGVSRGNMAGLYLSPLKNSYQLSDKGALPNMIQKTISFAGTYIVKVTNLFNLFDRFIGDYCVTLQSDGDAYSTFWWWGRQPPILR